MSFDLSNLEEISGGDKEFISGALQLFVSKKGEYSEMHQKALASDDVDLIRQSVHKMKSSVSVIGYNSLRSEWAKLEVQLESGLLDANAAKPKAEEVFAKYLGIVAEVESFLKSY